MTPRIVADRLLKRPSPRPPRLAEARPCRRVTAAFPHTAGPKTSAGTSQCCRISASVGFGVDRATAGGS